MQRTEVLSNLIVLVLSPYASKMGKGMKRKERKSKNIKQFLQTAKEDREHVGIAIPKAVAI